MELCSPCGTSSGNPWGVLNRTYRTYRTHRPGLSYESYKSCKSYSGSQGRFSQLLRGCQGGCVIRVLGDVRDVLGVFDLVARVDHEHGARMQTIERPPLNQHAVIRAERRVPVIAGCGDFV